MPFIHETLDIYKFKYSDDLLIKFGIKNILCFLENIGDLLKYRRKNNISELFFRDYDITINDMQHIEFNFGLYFSKHNFELSQCKTNEDILSKIDTFAKEFIGLNEFVTEILIIPYKSKEIEEKSEMITKIITTLPELLLREFSRQLGWLSNKYGYDSEIMDNYIQASEYIKEWFELCIEPILKGANNVLEWTKKAL